ncbi:MAG: hypothetical protein EAZ70_04800 [Runella slithyformis]|nr:MAG: hypothetical protein EAY79_05160 [Runella slithyformis]TAF28671.1 MAG: hypothetical protein EAZ70_04800 [Runella slithyformis]TAF82388.1 MAG: hypothetical protein EAZ50_04305 [Runella slithyformis]
MVATINIVLKVYASILNGKLSYPDADRWAWKMIQLSDNEELEFNPKQDEKLIWQLILYLYGIDMINPIDKTKTIISNSDIIVFLKEKGVYNQMQ